MRTDLPRIFGSKSIHDVVGRRVTGRNPYIVSETYIASGAFHEASLGVVRQGRRERYQLSIHIDCSFDDPVDESNGIDNEGLSVSEMLTQLESLEFNCAFFKDIYFEFGSSAAHRIFPLKLPIFAETIVDEFRGIRGVKLRDGELEYVLSLDSPNLETLYVNLESLGPMEPFTVTILHDALAQSVEIVRQFIPPRDWR